jgi:hypothetical protein
MLLRPLSNAPDEQELPADPHAGTPKELSNVASCGPLPVGDATGEAEIGEAEMGLDEVGEFAVGLAEVGEAEMGLAEVGEAVMGLAEVGGADVGLAEVGEGEIGLAVLVPHR